MNSEPAVLLTGLTKSYGRRRALAGVDLTVPRGRVFGYLGPNGAGKTTTIRLMMGSLRPPSGSALLLGCDSVRGRQEVHRRVGYLPGDFAAHPHLDGRKYLRFLAALRRLELDVEVERLAKRFDLDLDQRIGTLSHGNRQKLGIIQAWMHRPELLVLDEPTSGLDPLMQREFVSLVQESAAEGSTVFLSSHSLSEVEAAADDVAILRRGRVAVSGSLEQLKGQARRRLDLTFSAAPPVAALRAVPETRAVELSGPIAHVTVEGSTARLLAAAAPYGVQNVVSHEPNLEEVFFDYYDGEHR